MCRPRCPETCDLGDSTARSPANVAIAAAPLSVHLRHFRSRAASLSFTSHHLTVTRQSPATDKRGTGGYLLAFAAATPGTNHPWKSVLPTPQALISSTPYPRPSGAAVNPETLASCTQHHVHCAPTASAHGELQPRGGRGCKLLAQIGNTWGGPRILGPLHI
jgi:hypothetical protein